jgi:hypothetical protein
MVLKTKRLIISNEIKNTVELNGDVIKKISSGGDPIVARMHCGNEEEVYTHFLPICLANDLPRIMPYDDAVDTRLRIVSFQKAYVDEPKNEYELLNDNNISNEINTLEFQKAFVGLLIYHYTFFYTNEEPEEAIQAKQDWSRIDDSTSEHVNILITKLLEDYKLTDDANDFTKNDDLETWPSQKRLGITINKLSIEIEKYLKLNGKSACKKSKKLNGKVYRGWIGLKLIEESYDEESNEASKPEEVEEIETIKVESLQSANILQPHISTTKPLSRRTQVEIKPRNHIKPKIVCIQKLTDEE